MTGTVIFPGDETHGMRVAYLGRAGGYEWVRALEDRGGELPVKAGEEFVWSVENIALDVQLELFS